MNSADVSALSAAIRRGIDSIIETIDRAASGCPDRKVVTEITTLKLSLAELLEDHIEGGLDHIASRRQEDDVREAEFTRGCEAYHARRDRELEDV